MESGKVKVNIFGQTYSIKGDAPEEYILELANYVNEKMEEVQKIVSNTNSLHIAILVALNISDEYFQARKLNTHMGGDIEEKTREIISMLDKGLIGDIFAGAENSYS
ncbi:MAG: cell division protein ZapA [Spirochaetota bacterium]